MDIVNIDDPKEIVDLSHDYRMDRKFHLRFPILNWLTLKRSLSVLSFEGKRFPTMVPRDSGPAGFGASEVGCGAGCQSLIHA
jgi:hypothetical protein